MIKRELKKKTTRFFLNDSQKKKTEGKTKISVQQSRNVRLATIVSPIDRRNDRTCSKKKKKKRISLRAPFISFRHPAFCQTFHFYLRVSCFLAPAPTTPSFPFASFSSSPRPTFSSSTTFGFLYNFCLPSWGYHHCRKQKGNVYDRLITANSREQGT